MITIPADKALHFAAGAIAAALGVLVLPWLLLQPLASLTPAWHAALATAAAAVLREAYNHAKGGRFDWRDVAATLLGGLPVLAVTLAPAA